MRLFSYVVARDYGFAPNPFGGWCTLATCKPRIRQKAVVGDWIVGLAAKRDKPDPSLVYVMRVDEVLSYDAYWNDPRFFCKKPSRLGSLKQVFGDNIYHRNRAGEWCQADSHHSHEDGSPNLRNIANDTQSERVLIGKQFAYWGSNATRVPAEFINFRGYTIQVRRSHRNRFPSEFVEAFLAWFEASGQQGCLGQPFQWTRPRAAWIRRPIIPLQ